MREVPRAGERRLRLPGLRATEALPPLKSETSQGKKVGQALGIGLLSELCHSNMDTSGRSLSLTELSADRLSVGPTLVAWLTGIDAVPGTLADELKEIGER